MTFVMKTRTRIDRCAFDEGGSNGVERELAPFPAGCVEKLDHGTVQMAQEPVLPARVLRQRLGGLLMQHDKIQVCLLEHSDESAVQQV